ncbi:sulfite exporter TauE/SafE family protein [Saccharomonospora piscinae]|uniref:Probable membrane transporter protein n=1 Tax=Saccharomonospora piscinae TaxID=687388 RepID=A0A1V9A1F8_SACPI|nr:sulfite exporter TauE/SafE family protein [Saccharomonospora piscinae]OQO90873.1 anion permease [Saccharomonospora piscinae]TLW93545.1 sulfite exporter TauE/SafE family protein [Saccharomonospora piscinae]
MIWWHAVLIAVAGVWAGMINTVVGSGTLVTFPVLVALGYPPVTATTSNAIGLAPGSISGAIGYRHELRGQGRRLLTFVPASLLGAIGGSILLLSLPADAFETIVPALVGLAVVLVIVQPRVSSWVLRRREERALTGGPPSSGLATSVLVIGSIFLIGIYGGYFTAAQGVMLMAVMGMLLDEPIQRLNGVKNVLSAVVNVVAGTVYAFVAPVNWAAVGLLAVGSVIGGLLGARVGRRLSPTALRAVIVVVGVAAVVQLILRQL